MILGLGMYPDETCFDSSRPGWLPYWLDDLTESACFANEVLTGNQTGNTAQPGTPGVAAQTLSNAQNSCASSGGTWNDTLSVCQQGFIQQYGIYLAGAGVLLIAATILGGRR